MEQKIELITLDQKLIEFFYKHDIFLRNKNEFLNGIDNPRFFKKNFNRFLATSLIIEMSNGDFYFGYIEEIKIETFPSEYKVKNTFDEETGEILPCKNIQTIIFYFSSASKIQKIILACHDRIDSVVITCDSLEKYPSRNIVNFIFDV